MSAALDLARELLQEPREAGTPAGDTARSRIETFLTGQGYHVERQRFSFSTSGLLGLPVFGAGLGWLTILQIPLLVMHGIPPWGSLLTWLLGLVALGIVCAGLSLGWAEIGGESREDANLVATRSPEVRCWMVAHYDTKAQGHSMAGRLVAVWMIVLATIVLTVLAIMRLGGPLSLVIMQVGAGLGIAAGFLAGRGRLRGQSPGARDNGSGLLAVLVAAEELRDPGVGILVTGAEEFGLIGARYFAERCPHRLAGRTVINFDTVDDRGLWRVVQHRPNADALVSQAERAIRGVSPIPVRRHRMPLGIFVDSFPLARAGAVALTLARLDWSTLRRIHTPRDTLEGLTLESAVVMGKVGVALAEMDRE